MEFSNSLGKTTDLDELTKYFKVFKIINYLYRLCILETAGREIKQAVKIYSSF